MAELLTMDTKRNSDKQKALDSALAQIERQFGKFDYEAGWGKCHSGNRSHLDRFPWA